MLIPFFFFSFAFCGSVYLFCTAISTLHTQGVCDEVTRFEREFRAGECLLKNTLPVVFVRTRRPRGKIHGWGVEQKQSIICVLTVIITLHHGCLIVRLDQKKINLQFDYTLHSTCLYHALNCWLVNLVWFIAICIIQNNKILFTRRIDRNKKKSLLSYLSSLFFDVAVIHNLTYKGSCIDSSHRLFTDMLSDKIIVFHCEIVSFYNLDINAFPAKTMNSCFFLNTHQQKYPFFYVVIFN